MRKIFILFSGFWFLVTGYCFSDTIERWDGRELKGIVVEDYKDRVVLSTPEGEIEVMKQDIRALRYDIEEENLVKLGDRAKERGEYALAYSYYDKALKINPDSKTAKDGAVFLQGYLFRINEAKKEEDIRRRAEFEQYQTIGPDTRSAEELQKEELQNLKSSLGITLRPSRAGVELEDVNRHSPAADAGLKGGDRIIAIWGKLTGYMELKEVVGLLLKQEPREIKMIIERDVDARLNKKRGILSGTREIIGARMGMEFDGLTLTDVTGGGYADRAGLKEGDLIVSLDGRPTRYMPLKTALKLIKANKKDSVNFSIRREATIWRR
ncbi:MAG: hypothetical protein A2987_05505 [Omnitrophica bacterium RIFCSPLOWO2_01_FULL_45_10]|nr:MAG: hypothetical protein A2987_05505 [Omnitrophica bacterium RIFCSPLOWO2_01_FULL_45_10]